jgi:hypothetical protein
MLKMTRKTLLIAAIPLVAGAISVGLPNLVKAQTPQPAVATPKYDVKVACCKCIGGESQTLNLNTGSNTWRVSGPGVTGSIVAPIVAAPNPGWINSLAPAKWIAPNTGATATAGVFVYELKILVPNCVIPMDSIKLDGKVSADNSFKATLINPTGGSTPIGQNSPTATAFKVATPISGTLTTPGVYTLRIEATNDGGPHATIVQAALKTKCSERLEKQNGLQADPTTNVDITKP